MQNIQEKCIEQWVFELKRDSFWALFGCFAGTELVENPDLGGCEMVEEGVFLGMNRGGFDLMESCENFQSRFPGNFSWKI
jgi:hypothetical protein